MTPFIIPERPTKRRNLLRWQIARLRRLEDRKHQTPRQIVRSIQLLKSIGGQYGGGGNDAPAATGAASRRPLQ